MQLLERFSPGRASLLLAFVFGATIAPVFAVSPDAPIVHHRIAAVGHCRETKPATPPTPPPAPVARATHATIETSLGTLHCTLFGDDAPHTVDNFAHLAHRGFYDHLTFHRVIPEFVIQGGDPLGNGTGGPGYEFADEISSRTFAPGTLAMANKGPNTNGSQFFISEGAPQWLNGHETIFGTCAELDVVKKIARVPRDAMDKPLTPVVIEHVIVE